MQPQIYRRFGAFSSSEDPEQLGSTVKGFILGIGVVVIFVVTKFLHINFTADDVNSLAESVGAIVSSVWIAYGLVKKLIIWAIDKWQSRSIIA